ncbi:hypothetical protein GmHk_04G010190 [Glycine max]|nr:hypothetical protein GmHk_04G010190 [Glycine max]
MVRTRGLGRALGTSRGRDMSQDAHQPEVSRHRRPTASVHRQWVHVTEDVTQTPEDVPQLNEDVPHVSDATPEMTGAVDAADAEGVASDGSLGSPPTDEGFPCGPRDPSVLTGFAEHVAHSIWSGEERPNLKFVSHGRKVDKFGRLAPEMEGMIAATGLSPLILDLYPPSSRELTITLDDVLSLLHLPITGALHAFEPLVTFDAVGLLTELLEVTPEEATAETHQAGGPHVWLSWLRDVYQSRCRARQVQRSCHAPVSFQGPGPSRGILLGNGCIGPLASQTPTQQMAGYITLLQCWIYEHFLTVHQCIIDDAYAEASPRASRWLTSKAHMTRIKRAQYQARIEALTVTNVFWMPYAEHRGVRGFDLISAYTGQLRWGQIVVYVRPERVVRQFRYIQTVPPPPIRDSLTDADIDGQWLHFSDHLVPAGEICAVPVQVAPDYMDWFFWILHPFVTPTEDNAELRHPPTPHDEEFVKPPIPEVDYQGCQGMAEDLGAIAEDLERVINLRMVIEGTDLYAIMARYMRRVRGDAAYGNLRPRQRRRID